MLKLGLLSPAHITVYNTTDRDRSSSFIRASSRYQRWSRGHKARGQGQGQGHKKNPRPRPRTAFPRTDTLEAKDRNARGQGQGPRPQAQVLSKKKVFTKIFLAISKKKKVFTKIFQALHKILTIQKRVLSSSRGQANFWGLEASRSMDLTFEAKAKDFKMCPRGLHLWPVPC